MKEITDATFNKEVLQSKKPVLVDFWAPWCAPCKRLAPILEELSTSQTALEIVKLNTDENLDTANAAGVLNLPTLNVYVNGELVKSLTGAMTKRAILKALEEFIK